MTEFAVIKNGLKYAIRKTSNPRRIGEEPRIYFRNGKNSRDAYWVASYDMPYDDGRLLTFWTKGGAIKEITRLSSGEELKKQKVVHSIIIPDPPEVNAAIGLPVAPAVPVDALDDNF